MNKVFFILGILSFTFCTANLLSQEKRMIPLEYHKNNEILIWKELINKTGTKYLQDSINIKIIYNLRFKSEYETIFNLFRERGSTVIDSLLNNQINFTDIFEPVFISESQKGKTRYQKIEEFNPIIFQFIVYKPSHEIFCIGNNNLIFYFMEDGYFKYLLDVIDDLQINEVFFFWDIANFYGLSKYGKLYKIYTTKKKVICYDSRED